MTTEERLLKALDDAMTAMHHQNQAIEMLSEKCDGLHKRCNALERSDERMTKRVDHHSDLHEMHGSEIAHHGERLGKLEDHIRSGGVHPIGDGHPVYRENATTQKARREQLRDNVAKGTL